MRSVPYPVASSDPSASLTPPHNTLLWRLALEKLRELRGEGLSDAEIRLRYGLPGDRLPADDEPPPAPAGSSLKERLRERFGLTPAQVRVALLLAEGKSNAAIAQTLFVSASTARRHTEHVLLKLGIHSRAEVGPKIFLG